MGFLLKNAEVITINEEQQVLQNACVGVSGNMIDYIGSLEHVDQSRYDRVIDLKGKAVMPGLVNGHGHAAMVMFRNYADDLKLMDWLFQKIFPLEDKLNEEIVYWGSKLACIEMLKSGTTTFTDMYFFMDATARAVQESGIRACLSRGLVGDPGDGQINDKLQEALDFHTRYDGTANGRIKVNLGPHSIYTCSVPYLKTINEISLEKHIPMQIHLSETNDEVNNCKEKFGKSPVELLEDIGLLSASLVAAHCVVIDDKDLDILARHKVNAIHNPGSNLKLASGIAPVQKMLQRGMNVAFGTDGAASNNNLDLFEEMRLAAYLQKAVCLDPTALTVDQALAMATKNGAKALGFEKLGVLSVGYKADLIVIDTDKPYYHPRYNTKAAIVYSGNSSDVFMSIVDGEIVMEHGAVVGIDEEKTFYEIERLKKQLVL